MDLFFPPEQSEKFEFKASAIKIGFDELTSECAVNVGLLQPQDRLAVIVMCWKTIGDYLTENQYDPFVEKAVSWIGRYTLELWFGRDWSSCATESKTSLIENMMKVYPAAYINMHPYSWPYMFAIYCDPWMVDYLNVNFTRMNTVDTLSCLDAKDSDFIQHEGISLIILRMTSMFDFGMIKLVKFLCLRLLLAWRDPSCAAYMVLHSTPKSALYIELVIHIYLIAIFETNGMRDLHYVLEYIQRCQHCNAIEIGPLETSAQTIANVLKETKTGLLEFLNGFILQVPDRSSDNIFGLAVGKYVNLLTDYLIRKIHSLSSPELFSPCAPVYTKLVGMYIKHKESTEDLMKSAAGLSEKLFSRVHNLSALTISYEQARQRTRPEWYTTKITLLFAIISEELNILEDYKYTDDQKSEEILLKEQQIATYYRDLAKLLTKIPYLEQEAWLTTFSLHPCKEYMEAVVKCGSRNLRAIKKQASKFKPIDPAQEAVVKVKRKKNVKKEVELIKDIPKPPQLDPELPCTSAAFLASLAGAESKRVIIEPSETKEKSASAVKTKKTLIAKSEEKSMSPKKGRGRPPGKANTAKSVEKKKLFAIESGKKDPDKKTDKYKDAADKCKDAAEIIYAAAAGAADIFSYQSAEAMKFPLFALINSVTDTEDLIKYTDYDEEITQYNELNRILSNLKTRNTGYNDVLALLISPRYKRLTWVICWKQLKKRCRELTTKDTRKRQLVEQYMADANDRLTYLNIDYDKYKDKPQIDYGSIEDGYECYDTDSEDDTLTPVVITEDGNVNVPPTSAVPAKRPSKVRNPASLAAKSIGKAAAKKESVNRKSSETEDALRNENSAVSKSIITQLSQETILENVGTPPAKILEQFASNLSTPIFLSRPVYFVRRPTESEHEPLPSPTLRQQNPTTDDQGENKTVRGRNKYIILSNTPSPVIAQAQSKRSSRRSSSNEDFLGSDSLERTKSPTECNLKTLADSKELIEKSKENSLGDTHVQPQISIDHKDSTLPAKCNSKVVFSATPKPLFSPSKQKILRRNRDSSVCDTMQPKIDNNQGKLEKTSSKNTNQQGSLRRVQLPDTSKYTTAADKISPVIAHEHRKPVFRSRRFSIHEIPINNKKCLVNCNCQKLRKTRHKSVSYHRTQKFTYEIKVNSPDSQCSSQTVSASSPHSETSISSPKDIEENVDILLSEAVQSPSGIDQGDTTTTTEIIPKTVTSTIHQSLDSASLQKVIKKGENPVGNTLQPEKSTNQSVKNMSDECRSETPINKRDQSFSSTSSQDVLKDIKDSAVLLHAKEPLASVSQSCSSQTNLDETESSVTQPQKSIASVDATLKYPTGLGCDSSQSPTQQDKINDSSSKSASIQALISNVNTTTAEPTIANSSSLPTNDHIETVLRMLYQAFQPAPTDSPHVESAEPLESKPDDPPLEEIPDKYNNPVDDSFLYKDEDKVINNNLLSPHLKTYSNYKAPFRTAKKDEPQNSRLNMINMDVEHTESAKDKTNPTETSALSSKIDQLIPSLLNTEEQHDVANAQIDKVTLQVVNGRNDREKSPVTENVSSDLLMLDEDLPQAPECLQSSSSPRCHLDVSKDSLASADPSDTLLSSKQTTLPSETQQTFYTSLDSEVSGDSKPLINALSSSRLSLDGSASVKRDSFNFPKLGESSILCDWLEEEELKKPTNDSFDVCESEKNEKKEKSCVSSMSSLIGRSTTELGDILEADDSAVSFEEPLRVSSVVEKSGEAPILLPIKLKVLEKSVHHILDSNLSTKSLTTEVMVSECSSAELLMENESEKTSNMSLMAKPFEKSEILADLCEHSTSDSPISIEKIRVLAKTPARELMERSRPSSAGSGVESEINKLHEAEVSEESNISCMRSASAGSSALMLSEQISARFAFNGRESAATHHLSPDPLALESPSLLVAFSAQTPDDDDSSLSRKDSDSLSKTATSKRQYRRRNLKYFARRSFRYTRGDSEVDADKANDCATTSTANNSDGSDYLPQTRRKKVVIPMKLRYRRSTIIDVNECSSCSSNIKIKVEKTPPIKRVYKRRHSTRGERISKSYERTRDIKVLNATEMEAFERYNCRNVSVSLSRLTTQQAEMCRKPYIKVKRCPLISCLLKRKNEMLDSSPVPRKRSRSIFRRSQVDPLVPCILIRKNEVVEPVSFGQRRRSRSSFRSQPTKDINKNMPKLF